MRCQGLDRALPVLLAAYGLACVTTESPQPAPKPGHGGKPGSACTADSAKTLCDPDLRVRVRCADGTWQALETCTAPAICVETAHDASCRLPPPPDETLALACSRYVACMPGYGSAVSCILQNERAAATRAHAIAAGYSGGVDETAVLNVSDHVACITAAKDCTGVETCVRGPVAVTCPASTARRPPKLSGCQGSWAWRCNQGRVQAMDCAKLGLQCGGDGDFRYCSRTVACGGPKKTWCDGSVAVMCSQRDEPTDEPADAWVALSIDCGGLGMVCRPSASNSHALTWCAGAGGPCPQVTGTEHCVDGKLRYCHGGGWTDVDCAAFGAACKPIQGIDSSFDCVFPTCVEADTCTDDVWTWCRRGGRVSVDCRGGGLVCGKTKFGVGCVFPAP